MNIEVSCVGQSAGPFTLRVYEDANAIYPLVVRAPTGAHVDVLDVNGNHYGHGVTSGGSVTIMVPPGQYIIQASNASATVWGTGYPFEKAGLTSVPRSSAVSVSLGTQPHITNVTREGKIDINGNPYDEVVITGTGFGTSKSFVDFGYGYITNSSSYVLAWSNTIITAKLPSTVVVDGSSLRVFSKTGGWSAETVQIPIPW